MVRLTVFQLVAFQSKVSQLIYEQLLLHKTFPISVSLNLGGVVTVMNEQGQPVQVAANSLQMAGVQNSSGIFDRFAKQYFF